MYAPKFKSWLTDQERFNMALDYKLTVMADAALAEIMQMAKDAMPPEPVKVKSDAELQELMMRNAFANHQNPWQSQLAMAQMRMIGDVSPWGVQPWSVNAFGY